MTSLPEFDFVRVLCVGDVMLDRFVHGAVKRISPESPVPIIHTDRTVDVPGGAANVARNISALGGRCTLIGVVGNDQTGEDLRLLLGQSGMIAPLLISDSSRCTSEKIRFVAQGQQLLRADREVGGDISHAIALKLISEVRAAVSSHHVLVLSDYAKGVLTDEVIAELTQIARSADVPIVVDPKSLRLARYAGATVVTPNAKEAGLATGIDVNDDSSAVTAAEIAILAADVDAILLTRAEQGMSLVQRDGTVTHLPAHAREVFDVVGAGDTVVATLALCLGAKLPMIESALISNVAAGVVVGKHGTATLTRSELDNELIRLKEVGSPSSAKKVISVAQSVSLRQAWAEQSLSVGFTNGCFDILHIGHVAILEFARSQCDRLVVGVNTDASVARLKGPSRPINFEQDRARILAAFGFIDAVVLFSDDTPYEFIEKLQPDLLVKGSDYTVDQVVGFDIVQKRGGRVITFDLIAGKSTSNIISRSKSS